jgi:hypothetical protein
MKQSPLTAKDGFNGVFTAAGFMGGGAAAYFLLVYQVFDISPDSSDAALGLAYFLVLGLAVGAYGLAYLCCGLIGSAMHQKLVGKTYLRFALLTPLSLPWIIVAGIADARTILPVTWISLSLIYFIARYFILINQKH